jgi:hypothetical protein
MASAPTTASFTIGVLEDERIAGLDASGIAALLSRMSFERSRIVFVTDAPASDANLGAGPAATAAGAPLLIAGATVPDATAREIERLGASSVIVYGAADGVSDEAARVLAAMGCIVERVAPVDMAHSTDVAYVVGDTYADRLIVETIAAARPGPVVKAADSGRLTAPEIIVASELPGVDRYALSVSMAVAAFPSGTAVFLQAGLGAVVLLSPDGVPMPATRVVDALHPSLVAVLGEV